MVFTSFRAWLKFVDDSVRREWRDGRVNTIMNRVCIGVGNKMLLMGWRRLCYAVRVYQDFEEGLDGLYKLWEEHWYDRVTKRFRIWCNNVLSMKIHELKKQRVVANTITIITKGINRRLRRAYKTWLSHNNMYIEHSLKEIEKVEKIKRVVRKVMVVYGNKKDVDTLRHAFGYLASCAKVYKLNNARFNNGVDRIRHIFKAKFNGCVRRSFAKWRQMAVCYTFELQAMESELERQAGVLKKFCNVFSLSKSLRKAWLTWIRFDNDVKILEFVFRENDKQLEVESNEKRLRDVNRGKQLKIVWGGLVTFVMARVRDSFLTWKQAWSDIAKKEKVVLRTWLKLVKKGSDHVCDALTLWRINTIELFNVRELTRINREKSCEKLRIILALFSRRRESRLFHQWKWHSARLKQQELAWTHDMAREMGQLGHGCDLLRGVMKRTSKSSELRAWNAWKDVIRLMKVKETNVRVIIRRRSAKELVHALNTWKMYTSSEVLLRNASKFCGNVIRAIVKRSLARESRRAFNKWKTKVLNSKAVSALVLRAWGKTNAFWTAWAWRAWTAKVAERKSRTDEMSRLMTIVEVGCNLMAVVSNRMSRRSLEHGFMKWRKQSRDKKKLSKLVDDVWAKTQHAWKRYAWKMWSRVVIAHKDFIAGGAAIALSRTHAIFTILDVASRYVKGRSGLAFWKWRREIERRKGAESRIRCAIVLRMRGVIGDAWMRWGEQVRRINGATLMRKVASDRLRMIVVLKIRGDVVAAWRLWTKSTLRSRVLADSIWRVARRKLSGTLGKAWEIWWSRVEERVVEERVRKRAAVRLRRLVIYKMRGVVGTAWRIWAEEVRRSLALAEMKRNADERLRRLVSRRLKGALWAAWKVWSLRVEEGKASAERRRDAEAKIGKVVRKVTSRSLILAWTSWRRVVEENKALIVQREAGVKLVKQALQRMVARSLSLAWTSWRRVLEENEALAIRRKAGGKLAKRALQRMVAKSLSLAWRSWNKLLRKPKAGELSASRVLAMLALVKLTERGARRAFGVWKFASMEKAWGDKKVEGRFRDVLRTMRLGYAREMRIAGVRRLGGVVGGRERRQVAVLFERWKVT
jgi:hypothetical protein